MQRAIFVEAKFRTQSLQNHPRKKFFDGFVWLFVVGYRRRSPLARFERPTAMVDARRRAFVYRVIVIRAAESLNVGAHSRFVQSRSEAENVDA